MWRVVKAMEQRESGYSAFGPRFSTGTDDGRGMMGREGHFQLGKGGARRETDLAVVVLASACSPGSQPALRSARAIPRSRVACGAFNVEFTAIWVLFGRFRAVNTRNARILKENYLDHRRRRIKRDLEAATKHIEVSCQSSISWTFSSFAKYGQINPTRMLKHVLNSTVVSDDDKVVLCTGRSAAETKAWLSAYNERVRKALKEAGPREAVTQRPSSYIPDGQCTGWPFHHAVL